MLTFATAGVLTACGPKPERGGGQRVEASPLILGGTVLSWRGTTECTVAFPSQAQDRGAHRKWDSLTAEVSDKNGGSYGGF